MAELSIAEMETVLSMAMADARKAEAEKWKEVLSDLVVDMDMLKDNLYSMAMVDIKSELDKLASRAYMEMGRVVE